MAVSDQETVFPHVGNGVSVTFAYGCQIQSTSDLVVYVDDAVVTSGFTVNGIGSPTGGSVTFNTAPANGVQIRLERIIKLERVTDYQQNGDFLARVVNPDFDRLWMALQRLGYFLGSSVGGVSRVLKLGDGDTNGSGAYRALQNRIQDLADPVNMQDATNRQWVLTQLAALAADNSGQFVLELLAAASGASLVGFNHSQTYAAGTLGSKLKRMVCVTDAPFNADPTGATDSTAAFAAAVAYVIAGGGGGEIWAPAGTYLLNGTAGADTYKNGILLPDTNGDFSTRKGITIVGDGTDTVLKAGSANMIVLRGSRLYSGARDLKIDGASLSNVIGLGLVPESLTQTTELVSQSFQTYRNVYVENCTEGMLLQPGPDVAGAGSGAFYHTFDACYFNLNTRHVWMKKDVTGTGNRTTRTAFKHCIFTRGNTGVQIDGGTEIDFIGCNWEMIESGTSPNATPVAFFYNDTNPSMINLIGGYAEGCTVAVMAANDAAAGYVHLFGFEHDSIPHSSQALMPAHVTNRLRIGRNGNNPIYLEFGNNGFVNLTADPDGAGVKTLALKINGSDKERWNSAGSKTFYGSTGNVTFTALGNEIQFSRNGNNVISAQGGAGAKLTYYGLSHDFGNVAGTLFMSADSSYLYPTTDNARSLGLTGFRWSSVWAATGTIQTSDPRTKKDIQDSPLGLDFITKLRPVAYRFKVGSNKVVGDREVKPAVLDDDGNVLERAVMEPIIEPQPGKRLHYGFLTTEVKAALDACGVEDFGGWIKTNPDDPESEEALRYDEFISPMVRAIQELAAQVADLKAQLAAK